MISLERVHKHWSGFISHTKRGEYFKEKKKIQDRIKKSFQKPPLKKK
jgi:hypothetical protein